LTPFLFTPFLKATRA